MITVKVTFENGDHLTTGINTDLKGAQSYYLGRHFELYEGRPTVRAVNVEEMPIRV